MNDDFLTKIKLLTTTMILGSAIYEFMYFQGLGISISQAPISIADLIRGWVEWGTFGFGVLLSLLINELFLKRIRNWKNDAELISRSDTPNKLKKIIELPYTLIKYSGYFLLAWFFLLGEAAIIPTTLGFTVVAILIFKWLFEGSPYEERFLNNLSIFLIIMTVGLSISGFHKGTTVANYSYKSMTTSMKIENEELVKVIRFFDQWTLVKTNDNKLGWVNNQSNKIVRFNPDRYQFIGILCYLKKNYDFAKTLPIQSCKYIYEVIDY
jgi:hypothetical protein